MNMLQLAWHISSNRIDEMIQMGVQNKTGNKTTDRNCKEANAFHISKLFAQRKHGKPKQGSKFMFFHSDAI